MAKKAGSSRREKGGAGAPRRSPRSGGRGAGEKAERGRSRRDLGDAAALSGCPGFFSQFFTNLEDAIIATDLDFAVTVWSPSAEAMFGWRADEAIGRALHVLLDARPLRVMEGELTRRLREEGKFKGDILFHHRDGFTVLCHASIAGLRDTEGEACGLAGVLTDVTERRRMEEELRNFYSLFKAGPAVIYRCRVDRDFEAIFVSDNVKVLFGHEPREFLESRNFWVEHVHPDDRDGILAAMETITEGSIYAFEYRFLHKDGTYRWTRDEIKILRPEDGGPLELVGTWTDITRPVERRTLLEQERNRSVERLASANAELLDFAYSVSHDLREPLIVIRQFLQLMEDEGMIKDEGLEIGGKLRDKCAELLTFIGKLLGLSRAGRVLGDISPVRLSRLVERVFMEVRPPDVPGRLVVEGELPVVAGDDLRLGDAFRNILANSFAYRGADGEVLVTVSASVEGNEHVVALRDNGKGIPAPSLRKIFNPGYSEARGEDKGKGFGLAIARKIVEAHGGRLRAESEGPGKGALFVMTFPLSRGEGAAT